MSDWRGASHRGGAYCERAALRRFYTELTMSEFDPHTVWLDIPLQEQPPHHYRLLGIPLYENDAAVIEAAADRQMGCVKTQAEDQQGELAQKLLDEISAARVCLLNAEKRAEYDRELKARLADGAGAKVYRYRALSRSAKYTAPLFAVLFLVFLGVAPAYRWHAAIYPFADILATILLVQSVLFWRLAYRLPGVRIVLDDEALVYHSRRGVLRLPYDRMQPLRFPSVFYFGSWFTVSTEDCTVRITLALVDIREFVRALKTRLDTRGLSDRYDSTRFFRFLKTAEAFHQHIERSGEQKFALLTVAAGGMGLLFALGLGCGVLGTTAWVIASVFGSTYPWTACDVVFLLRMLRLADQEHFTCPPRDRAWERTVYRKALRWGIGAYLAISLGVAAYLLMTG